MTLVRLKNERLFFCALLSGIHEAQAVHKKSVRFCGDHFFRKPVKSGHVTKGNRGFSGFLPVKRGSLPY